MTSTEAVKEEVPAKVVDEKEEVEEKEKVEVIYDEPLPNAITVGRNSPLSFYMERARRIFRSETTATVSGRGDNISTACKLVEALKTQKVAKVDKISTGISCEPFFSARGDAQWTQPTSVITFKLSRGDFGEFIADYQQRKIVEIFEKTDEAKKGSLSAKVVEGLAMGEAFRANDEQMEKSKKFLSGAGDLDLPTFIKYASILIHPLLKNKVFKDVLTDKFKIAVSGKSVKKEDDDKKEEAKEDDVIEIDWWDKSVDGKWENFK